MQHPITGSVEGFPTNYLGRPRPALPERGRRRAASARSARRRASTGAATTTASARSSRTSNGDGRPDLYVANDEDPNRLYLNEPGRAARLPLRRPRARRRRRRPRTPAWASRRRHNGDGVRPVRQRTRAGQTHAVVPAAKGAAFTDVAHGLHAARSAATATGWGDSWVDLRQRRAGSTSCSRTARSRSRTCAKDAAPAAGARAARRTAAGVDAEHPARPAARTAAVSRRPTTTTTAASTSRSTRSAASWCCCTTPSPAGHWLERAGAAALAGRRRDARAPRRLAGACERCRSGRATSRRRIRACISASARDTSARELIVRYPDGTVRRIENPTADRVLTVER